MAYPQRLQQSLGSGKQLACVGGQGIVIGLTQGVVLRVPLDQCDSDPESDKDPG